MNVTEYRESQMRKLCQAINSEALNLPTGHYPKRERFMRRMPNGGRTKWNKYLKMLVDEGWAERIEEGYYSLTSYGRAQLPIFQFGSRGKPQATTIAVIDLEPVKLPAGKLRQLRQVAGAQNVETLLAQLIDRYIKEQMNR